jgi:AmmeMemoRadiSam system protein B
MSSRVLAPRRRHGRNAACLWALLAALLLASAAPAGGGAGGITRAEGGAASAPTHATPFFDERTFALAVRAVEAEPPRPMPGVRVLIIPHHWTAGTLIVGSLRDLAATRPIRRVILLGPNHTNSGGGTIIGSDLAWSTAFGDVAADTALLRDLTSARVSVEPDVLTFEHSVSGIVPAIRYYLPEARVLPLILKHTASRADVDRLAAALAPYLDDETVLVSAVDFSHGLLSDEALARNVETRALLEGMATDEILRLGNEHLDSPAAIAVAIETARRLGAASFEVRADTDSSRIAPPDGGPVTSYIVGYYR